MSGDDVRRARRALALVLILAAKLALTVASLR